MESFGILSMLAALMQTPTPLEPLVSQDSSEVSESVSNSADAKPIYSVDQDSNCKVYNPFPQENEIIRWNGKCKDGYAHGSGSDTIHINGKLVEQAIGTYDQGKLTGNGTLKMFDSDEELDQIYTGEFTESIMHGTGRITWANGNTYEGGFNHGNREGYGKFTVIKNSEMLKKIDNIDDIGGYDKDGNVVIEGIFIEDEFMQACKKADCPREFME